MVIEVQAEELSIISTFNFSGTAGYGKIFDNILVEAQVRGTLDMTFIGIFWYVRLRVSGIEL